MTNQKDLERIARTVIESHDNNEWDERTRDTDFGDALEALREALDMEPPAEREEEA